MSPDILPILQTRLMGKCRPATPYTITNLTDEMIREAEVDDVINNLCPSVHDIFISCTNRPKPKVINQFRKSVKVLLDQGYDVHQLIKMDETCINNHGGINVDKLRELLSNPNSD